MSIDNKKATHTCSNHADADAVVYCKECKMFFCKNCQSGHYDEYINLHNIVPISSVNDFDLKEKSCPKHEQPLNLICVDCIGKQYYTLPCTCLIMFFVI